MLYNSKRDPWITALLATAAMSMMVIACHYMFAGDAPIGVISVILLGTAHFTIWVMLETSYELGPSALVVRCGPIVRAIPIDSIYEIYPTDDPATAPALSLDRLCIAYQSGRKQRSLLISPERRECFLENLAELMPELQFHGQHAIHKDHLRAIGAGALVSA